MKTKRANVVTILEGMQKGEVELPFVSYILIRSLVGKELEIRIQRSFQEGEEVVRLFMCFPGKDALNKKFEIFYELFNCYKTYSSKEILDLLDTALAAWKILNLPVRYSGSASNATLTKIYARFYVKELKLSFFEELLFRPKFALVLRDFSPFSELA